jgi:hypothetical protein
MMAASALAPPNQVSQQQQGQPAPIAPVQNSDRPAHQIKIWTNEDLLETRTPADRYIFAKEDKAAADQAAQFQSLISCFAPDHHEPTAEETQKDISDTTKSIAEAEESVAQARRLVQEDPENLRTRDQSELNRRTAELNRLLDHLHTLQDRLQQLAPKPAGENPPVPASTAPASTSDQ